MFNLNNFKKEKKFYKTLIECGLKLEEPSFIDRPKDMPGIDTENRDYFHEKRKFLFPPDSNKIIRQKINQQEKQKKTQ